ncbi:tRNA (adenosine(37)-N6)-threonylcarbamoyltransferase complex ATPase subunit type 1 TsaE [Arenivirga flava]|uniref:tRNA threonylcarbamoyladenosine biosynthesis protein TsaE n=1 Tax=Arenivirga flava TaxID=1930060 RepID=A0AA37UEM6_9MICO|nr:tRNA (adenosine(37)-N6)-threonylcarbamoyltransferase complex ATPase subunit type 1 TsaE [Arenivirga flava]GMA28180.1 tRNA threonylcarbamoyladenosine biosynthesis protein TsaE [Arenivirga flava]
MNRIEIEVATPEAMTALGERIGAHLRAGDLLALNGELGAGKTTFTRGVGAALGVRGAVTSPTFVLARTHPSEVGGAPLVHVDAYRLASALELDDLDIDYPASVVVVEWAAGMLDGVSDSWLELEIRRPVGAETPLAEGEEPVEPRIVTLTGHGPRWAQLPQVATGSDRPVPR